MKERRQDTKSAICLAQVMSTIEHNEGMNGDMYNSAEFEIFDRKFYMNSDGVNMGASSVALLFWTIIYKIALIVIELAVFLISPGFARHYLGKYMWLFIVGIAVNVVSIFLYSIIVFSKNGAKNIAYFCTWLLHKLRIVSLVI